MRKKLLFLAVCAVILIFFSGCATQHKVAKLDPQFYGTAPQSNGTVAITNQPAEAPPPAVKPAEKQEKKPEVKNTDFNFGIAGGTNHWDKEFRFAGGFDYANSNWLFKQFSLSANNIDYPQYGWMYNASAGLGLEFLEKRVLVGMFGDASYLSRGIYVWVRPQVRLRFNRLSLSAYYAHPVYSDPDRLNESERDFYELIGTDCYHVYETSYDQLEPVEQAGLIFSVIPFRSLMLTGSFELINQISHRYMVGVDFLASDHLQIGAYADYYNLRGGGLVGIKDKYITGGLKASYSFDGDNNRYFDLGFHGDVLDTKIVDVPKKHFIVKDKTDPKKVKVECFNLTITGLLDKYCLGDLVFASSEIKNGSGNYTFAWTVTLPDGTKLYFSEAQLKDFILTQLGTYFFELIVTDTTTKCQQKDYKHVIVEKCESDCDPAYLNMRFNPSSGELDLSGEFRSTLTWDFSENTKNNEIRDENGKVVSTAKSGSILVVFKTVGSHRYTGSAKNTDPDCPDVDASAEVFVTQKDCQVTKVTLTVAPTEEYLKDGKATFYATWTSDQYASNPRLIGPDGTIISTNPNGTNVPVDVTSIGTKVFRFVVDNIDHPRCPGAEATATVTVKECVKPIIDDKNFYIVMAANGFTIFWDYATNLPPTHPQYVSTTVEVDNAVVSTSPAGSYYVPFGDKPNGYSFKVKYHIKGTCDTHAVVKFVEVQRNCPCQTELVFSSNNAQSLMLGPYNVGNHTINVPIKNLSAFCSHSGTLYWKARDNSPTGSVMQSGSIHVTVNALGEIEKVLNYVHNGSSKINSIGGNLMAGSLMCTQIYFEFTLVCD